LASHSEAKTIDLPLAGGGMLSLHIDSLHLQGPCRGRYTEFAV
jgi:hypothetical protein